MRGWIDMAAVFLSPELCQRVAEAVAANANGFGFAGALTVSLGSCLAFSINSSSIVRSSALLNWS